VIVETGLIFDIQHYAVHDGPGIRTLVFLKGCPLRCQWCCNPESQSFSEQLNYIGHKCISCFSCLQKCPYSSIHKSGEKVAFNYQLCMACAHKPCIDSCEGEALKVCGKTYTVSEVVETVYKDIDFYRNSGGGVTFSGGEPFAQPEFLLALLKACKERNVHTAIETCGYGNTADIKMMIPFTDMFLYDLKIINTKLHEKYMGKPNEVILENLAVLASSGKNVIIRIPMIPGITDTLENLGQIAELSKQYGIKEINLEPYHSLGEEKYTEFGMPGKPEYTSCYTETDLRNFVSFFNEKGLLCEVA
jgi:pyruvate formate lyase activating enzyme